MLHLAFEKELSLAELRVLAALAEGVDPEEVGPTLGIKKDTVDEHSKAIRWKLGMESAKNIPSRLLRLVHGLGTVRPDGLDLDVVAECERRRSRALAGHRAQTSGTSPHRIGASWR